MGAIAQRPNGQASKINSLRTVLEKGKQQLQLAMADHMDPDRMIRLALTAASKTPALLNCTQESIGLALLTASQLGLEPNGRDAHLVPYGKECQLIPDYKGLVRLAYKNPRVASFTAHAVYENDDFDYAYGTEPYLKHKPTMGERGKLYCAYAVCKLTTGQTMFDVMTKADIEKRKKVSKGSGSPSSPWNTWTEEMWAKTAAKHLSKFAPLGAEFDRAVDHDNQVTTMDVVFQEDSSSDVDALQKQIAAADDGEAASPEQLDAINSLAEEMNPAVLAQWAEDCSDGRTSDCSELTAKEADQVIKRLRGES